VAEPYLRQSPLAHRGLGARIATDTARAGLVLAERPFLAKVNLRGRPVVAAVKQAVGVDLPTEPNTVAEGNSLVALWLGPREWLLVGPANAERPMIEALGEALAGQSVGIVDVTEGRTVLRLSGPMVRDVLSMGCPLDLHPRSFGPARCAQSFLARSPIILHQVDAAPAFDVFVERSQSDYLLRWFETAAAPYGFAVAAEPASAPWGRPPHRRPDPQA